VKTLDNALAAQIIDNAVAYAILTMDRTGRILCWSRGAELIFGYGDEAIGMNFAELFTPSDRAAEVHLEEINTALALGRAEDTRWHVRKDGRLFWANGVTMAVDGSEGAAVMKIVRDETAARLAEEQRILLLNELNHRIKNTLATVQSIVEQTLRAAKVGRSIREDLTNRLMALSEAHNLLVAQNWAGADLANIVKAAFAPHENLASDRFQLSGPHVRLSPHQALSLALALHELTTNALKYGALSREDGRVLLNWNLSQDGDGRRRMTMLWRETGGPSVTQPERSGFGMRLLQRTFGQDSGGEVKIDFAPGGLRCVLALPLPDLEEGSQFDALAEDESSWFKSSHARQESSGGRVISKP
jgi:PAS domain S-box-containing protein